MHSSGGKLIVIEGTDGSGKKTQTELLRVRLKKEGHAVTTISFPRYGHKSAGPIEDYLNGIYGKSSEINPYASSVIFMPDRFGAAAEIRAAIGSGSYVILDRYVDSNAGHQGGKIRDASAREKFLQWLYHTEYELLCIPRPDLTLILRVPARVGQKLVSKKSQRHYLDEGKTHDGHEDNITHLKNSEEAYVWLAKKHPRDHIFIECVEGGDLLTPEEINERIWQALEKRI